MIKIEVKQSHIDNGLQGDCKGCAIALALKDQGHEPWVDDNWISVDSDKEIKYPIPRSALLFIDDFDSGREVKPFRFVLTRKILPIAIDLSDPLQH